MTFSLKFGFKEITTLKKFIEDQGQTFPIIETFYLEYINPRFIDERIKYS